MNNIFVSLMKSSIEKCIDDFNRISRNVFVNENGELIHPGEFGTYRERVFKSLIKKYIPARYDVGTGFIITSKGNVSTQCDLIIFDKENTPILENEEQRFFPVESVVGVIEVKSNITKKEFTEALRKLSEVKKLREDASGAPFVFKNHNFDQPFNPKAFIRDQIATFLVCESFTFSIQEEIDTIFEEIYKNIDKSLFHNMVLSIKDGLLLYRESNTKSPFFYAYTDYQKESFPNLLCMPLENIYKYEHFVIFLNYFFMVISSISVLFVEITLYLGIHPKLLYSLERKKGDTQ